MGFAPPRSAVASDAAGVSLRMRTSGPEPAEPGAGRRYTGPLAVPSEPGRSGAASEPLAGVDDPPGPSADREGDREGDRGASDPAPEPTGGVTPTVPPPSSVRDVPEHVAVAVGLGPRAAGTREERARLDSLAATVDASGDPTTQVRRLRPGQEARRVCRERRDELVVMIDYIADRPSPVVLAYDCGLGQALGVRAIAAASTTGLVAELWDEHRELMREGARPRRRMPLGPRARAGIIAGAAILVVGVAVGALVANALREESVVITVRP